MSDTKLCGELKAILIAHRRWFNDANGGTGLDDSAAVDAILALFAPAAAGGEPPTMSAIEEDHDREWLGRVVTKYGSELNNSEKMALRWIAEVDRLRTENARLSSDVERLSKERETYLRARGPTQKQADPRTTCR